MEFTADDAVVKPVAVRLGKASLIATDWLIKEFEDSAVASGGPLSQWEGDSGSSWLPVGIIM